MSSISSATTVATSLATQSTSDDLNLTVLKKAMDSEKTLAAGLLNAIPPAPVTSSVGHTVNTFA